MERLGRVLYGAHWPRYAHLGDVPFLCARELHCIHERRTLQSAGPIQGYLNASLSSTWIGIAKGIAYNLRTVELSYQITELGSRVKDATQALVSSYYPSQTPPPLATAPL